MCVRFSRGSAIAKIVGANAKALPNFEDRVTMYVYEELIDGKKLTEIINETHENVKYLPGKKLPANVVRINFAYIAVNLRCGCVLDLLFVRGSLDIVSTTLRCAIKTCLLFFHCL